jgi:hypothetical protein
VLPRSTDRMLGNREFAKVRREVATVRNFLHAGPEGEGPHVRRPRPEPRDRPVDVERRRRILAGSGGLTEWPKVLAC